MSASVTHWYGGRGQSVSVFSPTGRIAFRICSRASRHARFGRKPYETDRNPASKIAVETEHVCEQTSAERDRVSHDDLEDWLRVARRAADHAENLRCRRLLLERLGKPLFQLATGFAGRV